MTNRPTAATSVHSAGGAREAREQRLRRGPLPQYAAPSADKRLDLLRWPLLGTLLRSRWPQFLVRAAALAGLVLAILAGLLGTPVGSHNLGIVLVWIAWWSLLILLALPLLGRGWCSICPIPMPGEWFQHGALVASRPNGLGLKRSWPARFRNIWLQNVAFSLIAV